KVRGVIRGIAVSLEDVLPGRAAIEPGDRPEDVVDTLRYTRPEDIDKAGLSTAALAVSPWSGDYWPLYRGMLGRRYADPEFPDGTDWQRNYAYVTAHPASAITKAGDAEAIDRLSPAEKYDFLVGDEAGTLTAAMWNEGKAYYDRDGKVELWMGICD